VSAPAARLQASPAQATLARAAECRGVGLHTGKPASVTLLPAPAGHGVRFVRRDLPSAPQLPATLDQVGATHLATSLGSGDHAVGTVEHLLAALYAAGIDNLLIQSDGPELPILDGSARPWCRLIDETGRLEQASAAALTRVVRPVEVRSGERSVRLSPCSELVIDARVTFDHPRIGTQRLEFRLADFRDELSWARTFGFLDQVEALREAGYARGGSLDNAVVFTPEGGVLNPEGLRAPDEPLRHKLLDMVGDLALLGTRLHARVEADRPGHGMTLAVLRALQADPAAFERT
jgi:UDP-3-O-[3-hydroxymyristoyl] N-acetylglucosamine deacetylase